MKIKDEIKRFCRWWSDEMKRVNAEPHNQKKPRSKHPRKEKSFQKRLEESPVWSSTSTTPFPGSKSSIRRQHKRNRN